MDARKKTDKAIRLMISVINCGIPANLKNDNIEPPSVTSLVTGKSVICFDKYDLWENEFTPKKLGATQVEAIDWLTGEDVKWN